MLVLFLPLIVIYNIGHIMFNFDIILKNEHNLVDNKSLYHGFFNSIIKIVSVLIITSVVFVISFSYLIHHYQLATTTVEYIVILGLSTLLVNFGLLWIFYCVYIRKENNTYKNHQNIMEEIKNLSNIDSETIKEMIYQISLLKGVYHFSNPKLNDFIERNRIQILEKWNKLCDTWNKQLELKSVDLDYDFKSKQNHLIEWINNNTILFHSIVNHECINLITDNELNEIFSNPNITLKDFQNQLAKFKINLTIQKEHDRLKKVKMNKNQEWINQQYDLLNKNEYFKYIHFYELNNWIVLLDEFNHDYKDSDDVKNKTWIAKIEESKLKLHNISQNIQQLLEKLEHVSKKLVESEKWIKYIAQNKYTNLIEDYELVKTEYLEAKSTIYNIVNDSHLLSHDKLDKINKLFIELELKLNDFFNKQEKEKYIVMDL